MPRLNSAMWTMSMRLLLIALLATTARVADILRTDSFIDCGNNASIKVDKVDKVDIAYDSEKKSVTFDVAGTSLKKQNVTAVLNVTAYGNTVYTNSFNPYDKETFVQRLCHVPQGSFNAKGSRDISAQFANMIPAIAFQVPDIAAQATLQLNSLEGGAKVACICSQVSNGKTANVPAVPYIAACVVGFALFASGLSSFSAAIVGGGGGGGLGTVSPSPAETFSWFQHLALSGMYSVRYPPVCSNFFKNFGFSALLVPLSGVQSSIDSLRAKTGGNLTEDNVEFLKNATLVFSDGSTSTPNRRIFKVKRALDDFAVLAARETGDSSKQGSSIQHAVQGIQAYAARLAVPKSDIFMTALLVVAIVIAAIVIGILLVKVILEAWALFGSFPKSLAGFRKHYWESIARTITSLILILYGIWMLYCIFQFTHGDTTLVKALASLTLALFTAVLAFFAWKIWNTARQLRNQGGDANDLYYNKEIWVKYSLFYESYKMDYCWLFIPVIIYMFVKGAALAATDGRGRIQTIAQLIIEAVMLILLLWCRPFERKSGNINITIAVVRVLSVVCILVFVEEFGIKQTTQTVTGVVLIAVQSALTGILAILIAWNALNACCTVNPHRKRRKDMEKHQRDMDTLTPLDARNSLLLDHHPRSGSNVTINSFTSDVREKSGAVSVSSERYHQRSQSLEPLHRSLAPMTPYDATRALVDNAAPMSVRPYEPRPLTAHRDYAGPLGPAPRYGQEGWR